MRSLLVTTILIFVGCATTPDTRGIALSQSEISLVLGEVQRAYPRCGKRIRTITSCPTYIAQSRDGTCVLAFSAGSSIAEDGSIFFPVFLLGSNATTIGMMTGPAVESSDFLTIPGDLCRA